MTAFENCVRCSKRLPNGKKINLHKKSVFRSCEKSLSKKKEKKNGVLMNDFNCISFSSVYFYKNRQNVMETVT